MEEERLIHLLRGLPREPASGGFTARVLRRLDEPAPDKQPRGSYPQGWHPLHRMRRTQMLVATATIAALGVSVGLLQRESSPGALAVARTAADLRDQVAGMHRGSRAAYPSERALIRAAVASPADGFAGGEREIGMPGAGWPRSGAAERPGELVERTGNGRRLSSAQAHLILREMQLERGRLERELQSLRRRADRGYGTPPAVVYLGGDENVDLVLSTGRARAQGRPPAERDGGDFNNFLD